MPPGYREFEFDLPNALLTQLVTLFDAMDVGPLAPEAALTIPEAQGVYQLFHQNRLVYIGKTDAEAGLRQRLTRHAWTVQHRQNLEPGDVAFKAIRVYVFTAIDLETQLIEHYRATAPVAWNFSGFGSNDPGRERDTTNVSPEGFDVQFPVDLDREIAVDLEAPVSAGTALTALRRHLPYTFRFERAAPRSKRPHPELENTRVELPPLPCTTHTFLTSIIHQLPPGWQGTLLSGRVILYKENREYQFGQVVARS